MVDNRCVVMLWIKEKEKMEEPLKGRPGVRVSIFDCSIENHFRAMDTISKLCEEPESDGPDETDIQRFSSSITFLR